MRRILAVLLILVTAPCYGGALKDQVITPSVTVLLGPGGRGGTGTVIRHGGTLRILTAAHVVKGVGLRERVLVRNKSGPFVIERKAVVIRRDATVDLALLECDDSTGLTPATVGWGEKTLEPGEECWYAGYGSGLEWNLQKANVNQDDASYTTVNGGGWKGHSGSAVFVKRDGCWVAVGVMVMLYDIDNPKSPMLCVTRADVATFLDDPSRWWQK